MTSNYLTTCYKSYSIISSTKANLKLSTETTLSPYLILAKTNSLEFFIIKNSGELESKFEYQIFANILYITSIPSYSVDYPDHIFILTKDFQFSIASVNENQIIIDCYGDILYKELDQIDSFLFIQDHVICQHNSIKGYIGLLLYRNYLLVIPWKMSETGVLSINKVCKIKLNLDFDILNIVEFGSTSTILSAKNEYFIGALLLNRENNQSNNASFFKIYKIEDIDGELKDPGVDEGWTIKFPETINKIIYMKGDRYSRGLLAFGLHNVYFYLYETKTKYEKRPISLTVGEYVVVPNHDNFLILSDQKSGCLFLLLVDFNDSNTPIEVKYLGRTSLCSTMQYLEKKTIFIGSMDDNSYVLRILDTGKKEHKEIPYLTIMQTFHNLGNIIGIDLILADKNNKSLIVTSPGKKESLNLFQKGVTFNFNFILKIPAVIKNVFGLFEKKLVLCGIENKCYFFQLNGFGLNYLKEENFRLLYAYENGDSIVIVTYNSILTLDKNFEISSEIQLSSEVLFISKSAKYLCILLKEINQYNLLVYSTNLELMNTIIISKAVSAIYNNDNFIYVGYWFETSIDYYQISCPQNIQKLDIGSKSITDNDLLLKKYSVSSIEIWQEKFLLIGLNNGYLVIKHLQINEDTINVIQTKFFLIGDRIIKIFQTKFNGILICCDQTYILKIYEKPENFVVDKIWVRSEIEIYSLIEIQDINEMIIENEEKITKLLIICEDGIATGFLDRFTKYMITAFGEDNGWKKTQIEEQEIKNSEYHEKNHLTKEWVVVGSDFCITANNNINFDDPLKSELMVYSIKTQEILDCFKDFDEKEQINHLIYDESKDLIVLTTDTIYHSDKYNQEFSDEIYGKIYWIYLEKENYPHTYNQKLLRLICKTEMRNPIESIKKMKENHYIFYCGSMLYIYELTKKDKLLPKFDFQEVYKKDLRLNAFQLDVYDEYLIICDPYKNVNLYHYNSEENKLLFVAKIFLGGHLTFSSFYAKEKILCFDDNGNLIISQRKKKAETDLEKISLQVLSGLNFGEKLSNSIKINDISCLEYQKILNKSDTKAENYYINEIIWTSDRGTIGILAELPKDIYNLLMDLQESILLEIKGKGYFGFEYEKWRQVKDFLGNRIQNNFVDGDIIKNITEMPLETVEKILNRMSSMNKPKLADFLFLLEDLEKKLFS